MADVEDGEETCTLSSHSGSAGSKSGADKMFSLKKWNAVAMWSWDVECDTCAICRVQVMDACLRCQAENKQEDCVVVWGECNHSSHNCCMSLWVKQNNRCPPLPAGLGGPKNWQMRGSRRRPGVVDLGPPRCCCQVPRNARRL